MSQAEAPFRHRPRLSARMLRTGGTAAVLLAALFAIPVFAAQGIAQREVVVGTHMDLSGPLAGWGKSVRNGIKMALDDANSAGGINGRTLRLIVKDDGYDPARADDAIRALVNKDDVFAVLSPLGTPTVHAAARAAADKGVLYLFPVASGDDDFQSFAPFIFTMTPPNREAIAHGLRRLIDAKKPVRVGVLHSDDVFGRAVAAGAHDELARRGARVATSISFVRGRGDLPRSVSMLRRQKLDLVVLGLTAGESLQVVRAAQSQGWSPSFLCSSACYTPELATLAPATAGLYSVGQVPIPYPDTHLMREWSRRYAQKFHTAPTAQSLAGYRNARLFLDVLRRTGRTPTQENFVHALETLGPWTDPKLAGPPIVFSPDDHVGGRRVFLAQAKRGRWSVLPEDYHGAATAELR